MEQGFTLWENGTIISLATLPVRVYYPDIKNGLSECLNTHPALTSSPDKEANVASDTVTPRSFPAQPLTISSEQISRYAELSALVTQLEAQQKALRAQLLDLYKAGAEQETDSPYLLAFVEQERRTVDWKAEAFSLAQQLYGIHKAATWRAKVEQSAPVQPITQVRVKPNPEFTAGLTKPVASVRFPLTPRAIGEAARYGD